MDFKKQTYKFDASITLLSIGGRKKPIYSGFAPNFCFDDSSIIYAGIMKFKIKEAKPGDSFEARVQLISNDSLAPLNVDQTFFVQEGSRIIGEGKILKLLS